MLKLPMSFPNQLTVLRMMLTPVLAVVITIDDLRFKYLALAIFMLAAFTDWYDGYAARKLNKRTKTGKYLDPLADKLLVSTILGVFAFLQYIPVWMFLAIGLRDILITALRAYVISTRKSFETSNFAKWKTASQMATIFFLLVWSLLQQQAQAGGPLHNIVSFVEEWNLVWSTMLFVTVYTVMTGVMYLVENRHHLKSLAIAFYRVFVPTNVR